MSRLRVRRPAGLVALATLLAASCGPAPAEEEGAVAQETRAQQAGSPLAETLERSRALMRAVADTLKPVPLMRPAQENALRRHDNAAQLERARALGVRPAAGALDSLVAAGVLVELEDSTTHWVVRELDASAPYVTPDAYALLEEIGRRFQARLGEMGLPAFRLEITSALRTAEDQAALRRTNPNAASGTSTHEFGTTVDVAYTAFPAPAETPEGLVPGDAEGRSELEEVAGLALDAAAARKSRELQAILAGVLLELQQEGAVMVTLERLQPVFHMTVARRMAER